MTQYQSRPRPSFTTFSVVEPRARAHKRTRHHHANAQTDSGLDVDMPLPALLPPPSPPFSSCSTPILLGTPESPELATPPQTPFLDLVLPSPASPSPSSWPSPLLRSKHEERIGRETNRNETSRLRYRDDSRSYSSTSSPSPNRISSLKRHRSNLNNHHNVHDIPRVLQRQIQSEFPSVPRAVSVGVDFGLSPARGGSIVPVFYRGATAPVTVSILDPLPHDTTVRIRTILKCELQLGSTVPEVLCRSEEWHHTTPADAGATQGLGSGLLKDGYQTLGLVIPTLPNSPASHEGLDSLFTVRWTLDAELYATCPSLDPGLAHGRKEYLVGSATRGLTVLPSTSPSPVLLQEPIELVSNEQTFNLREGPDSDGKITTVQSRLESTTYSPNSLVPLGLAIRLPHAESTEGLVGLGLGLESPKEEEEQWLDIQTNLIREQRILHHNPVLDLQSLQDTTHTPTTTSEILARQDIGVISSTLTVPRSDRQYRSSRNAEDHRMIYHQHTFHLASRDGVWPHGYSTSVRSGNGLTVLSNSFSLETTITQYRQFRQSDIYGTKGPSLITKTVGYNSIPIIIGSVSEPRDAMYQAPDRQSVTQTLHSHPGGTHAVNTGSGRGAMDSRLVAVSNENGWKIPPPPYGHAITQPAYTPGMDWISMGI